MGMLDTKAIGERIKELRIKKGESQKELGDAIGLSQNAISKIEKGDTALTLENQFSIAEHFNVSHDYICIGKEDSSILIFWKNIFLCNTKALVMAVKV